jgi:hypothetical protein
VPEHPDSLPVPGGHGLRLDDDQRPIPGGPRPTEDDPEDAISGPKPWLLLKHLVEGELLAQGCVLHGQGRSGHEPGSKNAEQSIRKCTHKVIERIMDGDRAAWVQPGGCFNHDSDS